MRVEWRQFPLGLRVMLDSMAGQVDEEMESVIKRFDRWAEGLGDALEKVGHYIERNVVGIASEWDEAAPDPRSGRAEVKLDCGGIARDYDESGVEAAAAVLAAGKLSQGVYTQAHLFLLEYKEIEAGGAGDD